MPLHHIMDRFLRRLARHAARGGSAAAAASRSSPDMQPLPTPSVQYLAAAAANQPPVSDAPADVAGAAGSNIDWDMSTFNSSLTENFTLFTDGASHDLTPTPDGHVTSDQAWPVSSFAVIKALVLIVILAILLVVSCKVTMQYIIKSSKREKR
ncbi:uncharacterized protein LOC105438070 [Strongylocentrotus purpuratus]|uniref:Uncharacterized protein n=1 Tax=Strongylocentrotus purpuratus TaxID=7668 RepID=A0A7M7NUV3_STRPU|nr:uncharacterized protein LOC105438070 [Strongylocentrotus purpuratus]|eukprot:XP_011663714.1 PREDICTED: uncharacterized protein LOC105438070 [Strongylocentrotus purpuratus]